MKEIFKDIDGTGGQYQVSNLGRVKSLKHSKRNREDIILKPIVDHKGYYYINIYINGKHSTPRIHRLVAKAFIPNLENKPQINHIDGDKSNNSINNLEWVTNQENQIHAYKIGLKPVKAVAQFDKLGNFIKLWDSSTEASKSLNIDLSHIGQCCKHKRATAGGYKWEYPNKEDIL